MFFRNCKSSSATFFADILSTDLTSCHRGASYFDYKLPYVISYCSEHMGYHCSIPGYKRQDSSMPDNDLSQEACLLSSELLSLKYHIL